MNYLLILIMKITCFHKQVVAIKQLNHDGLQGFQEFIVEVLMLSLLHHSNLVTLISYCTDGDQRLLVYEYMSMGSLEDHLFGKYLSYEVQLYLYLLFCTFQMIYFPFNSAPPV